MRLFLIVLGMVMSPAAWSHGIHAAQPGFVGGLLHLMTGIDHVLAAAGMGLWLGLQNFTRRSLLLYAFALTAGSVAAAAVGGMITDVEWLLACTLIVTGLSLYRTLRLPQPAIASAIAMIFSCHFYAHITEIPVAMTGAATAVYAAGLFTATALIIAIAAMIGAGHGATVWMRISGAAIAAAGVIALGLA